MEAISRARPKYAVRHDGEFAATIDEGQTFIVGCSDHTYRASKGVEILKYMGTVQKDGTYYYEFLHNRVFIPDVECRFPDLVR